MNKRKAFVRPRTSNLHECTRPIHAVITNRNTNTRRPMMRIMFPVTLAGAFLARGSDAFVRPSVPLATFKPVVATSLTSTPRHSPGSLRLSTAVLPESAKVAVAGTVVTPAVSSGVKAPPDMYQNAVNIGEKKAAMPASKTFLMGIISGCHIAFGALLAITVGGNCPGLATTNPGLQKILFGAFGRQ